MNNSATILPNGGIYAELLKNVYHTYPSASALLWLLHTKKNSFQSLETLFFFDGSIFSEFSTKTIGVFFTNFFCIDCVQLNSVPDSSDL